jgi:hypothetical protein
VTPDRSLSDDPARALVGAGEAARGLADYCTTLVASIAAGGGDPGDLVTQARWVRVLALEFLDRSVIAERAAGRPWSVIAAKLRQPTAAVRARWEPAMRRWQAGESAPWHAELDGHPVALQHATRGDWQRVHAELVEWLRHRPAVAALPGAVAAIPRPRPAGRWHPRRQDRGVR